MSTSTSTSSTVPTGSPESSSSPVPTGAGSSELVTDHGRTRIAETVVAKIAGVAARDVHGVHRLGGGAARAVSALRERIPGAGTSATQGVHVEVGERQAAVDIALVVEYGASIAELAAAIRRNVITALERMTGLRVVEVNIAVNDVHLPTDESDGDADTSSHQPASSRVR